MSKERSIFEFFNYRDYLRHIYEFKKEKKASFSYRVFSRILGMKSSNYVKNIIDGKRNMPPETAADVARALELSKQETRYFCALVNWNDAQDYYSKEAFWQEVLKMCSKEQTHLLNHSNLRVITHWYTVALMEMVRLPDFKYDTEWIQKRFRGMLTSSEIEQAIDVLKVLGLIVVKGNGLKVTNERLFSGNEQLPAELVKRYHCQILDAATRAIHCDSALREFQTTTFGVKRSSVEKLKNKIREIQRALVAENKEATEPEEIYQLSIQLFPVTRTLDS